LLSYLLNDSDELRYLSGVNSKIGARVREVSWNLEVYKSSRFKFMVHKPNPDFCESGCVFNLRGHPIILKCGLGVQECKIISQKMQEEHFSKNFEKVYQVLTKDPIIGRRLSRIPVKYLTIGTSKAREVMSGTVLRKKYSAMKSYMNNTLSYLWRQ
jgi:hypothetical protein